MSYLMCDKCGNYHELQPDESPDDFTDRCECGGKLEYVDYDEQDELPNNKNSNNSKEEKGTPLLMILTSAYCVYGGNFNNNFLITLLGIIGIIFGLVFLIIRFKGLGRILDIRYMQLIYFSSAILFLGLSISLLIILLQVHSKIAMGIPVHTHIRSLGIVAIILFISIMFGVNMILKTMNPYKHTIFDPKY